MDGIEPVVVARPSASVTSGAHPHRRIGPGLQGLEEIHEDFQPIHANLPTSPLGSGVSSTHSGHGRVNRRRRSLAALPIIGLVVGVLGAVAAPASHARAAGPLALIYGPTVSGSPSVEQTDLQSQGWTVTVVSGATWDSMTQAQFASYQLLVFGDPTCGSNPGIQAAAVSNESTWAPIVNGNIIVIGTDPVFHRVSRPGADVLISHALAYAGAQAGLTGVYDDLSCYYGFGGNSAQTSPLLAGLESGFSIYTENSCSATIHVAASAQQLIGVTDANLSNWGCSVHEYFGTWPSDFVPYAIDTAAGHVVASGICPNPAYTPPDGTALGCPYIVGRGGGLSAGAVGLAGPSGTGDINTSQSLIASVQSAGSPVNGAVVTLTCVSGPNAGATAVVITGASGSGTDTYTSASPGTDMWTASYSPSGGALETTDPVPVVWMVPTTFTVTATPASVTYGTSSTLAESGLPGVSTGTVTFTSGGATLCTITRPATTCTTSTSLDAGSYPITATYSGDDTYDGSTASTALTVTQATTAITAVATPPSVPYGTASTLAASGLASDATGTVTFTSGGPTLCTATLPATTCPTSTSLVVGSYPITATYSGDVNYAGSTASTALTVTQASTSITATATPPSVPFGTSSTLAASGLPAGATGTLDFSTATATLCQVTLPASSCATVTSLPVGSYAITVTYSGDSNHVGSTASITLTVTLAPTTFTASAAPASVAHGTSSTLGATGLNAGATGTVVFTSGATTLCTATLPATTCSTSTALAAGVYAVTATYSGDASYAGSTASTQLTVTQVATSFTVAPAPASVPFGINPTLTEAGLPADATGTVLYMSGGTGLCTAILPATSCAPTTFFGVGTYPVTATYSGDVNYTGSTATTTFSVTLATTSTTVTSSLNPAAPDQTVVYTATVVSNPGGGTIVFTDNGVPIAGCTAVAVNALTGRATCTTTYPHTGTHLIAAAFDGTANYAPSTSPTVGVAALVEAIQTAITIPATGGLDGAGFASIGLGLLGLLFVFSARRRRRATG